MSFTKADMRKMFREGWNSGYEDALKTGPSSKSFKEEEDEILQKIKEEKKKKCTEQ